MFVVGIDVGKNFVSVVISDENGFVVARSNGNYPDSDILARDGRHEQAPEGWWTAVLNAIKDAVLVFESSGHNVNEIVCVACDGTSGTVFLAGRDGSPASSAILYDDMRCADETECLHVVGKQYEDVLGIRFNETYGLPKILWMKKNIPDVYESAEKIMHPVDYINFRLTGQICPSDYSTVLKSGYDIVENRFSDCVSDVGIDRSLLPSVCAPGTVIGQISREVSKETGLSVLTKVAAGATDGYASGLCSGAVSPGRWSTILGNTFVIKGVTDHLVKDSEGRIYCHKHPSGYFMPSGMSNAGGRCLVEEFGQKNLKKYDASVLGLIPTNIIVYPLSEQGERFPFVCPAAKKFVFGIGREKEMYTAHLEGLSYVERLGFETMEKLGCAIGDDVWAVGGSTKGSAWLKIRATVLKKNLHVPCETMPAMGAAMLAASGTLFGSLSEASQAMLREKMVIEPYEDFIFKYERLYLQFKDMCSTLYAVDL